MDYDFNQIAQALLGQECWAVAAGPSTGSMFILHIGEKVRRAHPLSNDKITETLRLYDSKFCVYIQMAAWRLDDYRRIITTWADPCDAVDCNMVRGLDTLSGTVVTKIEVDPFSLDLMISFSDKYRLQVFCDQVSHDNYYISIGSHYYIAGPFSKQAYECLP